MESGVTHQSITMYNLNNGFVTKWLPGNNTIQTQNGILIYLCRILTAIYVNKYMTL